MEYRNIIESCIGSNKQVSIEREEVDDEPITAIPIMISQQLLLIHYLYDFYLDGYKVLCISDITKIKRGYQFMERFFQYNDERKKLIDISLEKVEDETTFFVGKIKSARKDFLELRKWMHLEIINIGLPNCIIKILRLLVLQIDIQNYLISILSRKQGMQAPVVMLFTRQRVEFTFAIQALIYTITF